MRILIVEDEYPLADAISETLKKENFNVDIVTDGIDEENEALTGIYELILLDIMLPSKDGFLSISTIVLGVIILFAILNYNNTINAATSMLDRFDNFFRMPNDERTQTNNDDNIMKIDLSETYTYRIENGKIVDSIGNKNEDIEQYVYKAYKQNKEKGSTVLQVSNEGEEIPKKEREKIFERFYRVDKSRNRKEKRYGLGLAIAKSIVVEGYSGKIGVDCKDGITTFKIIL